MPSQILAEALAPHLSNALMLSWQGFSRGTRSCSPVPHDTDMQSVQAYQDRISQLFAGGADILDIKARSELASLVGLKVSSRWQAALLWDYVRL